MIRRAAGLIVLLIYAVITGPAPAFAQEPYPFASYPLPTSAAGDEGALGAIFNPAGWGIMQRPAVDFWWSDRSVVEGSLDNWGFALGKRLGFSAARSDFATSAGPAHVTDYQLGLGAGADGRYFGMAYGWSGG